MTNPTILMSVGLSLLSTVLVAYGTLARLPLLIALGLVWGGANTTLWLSL